MKGRMLLNGELQNSVYVESDGDLFTVYRPAQDSIEVLYTLLRGRLIPGDGGEVLLEGFIRKSGDPEIAEPGDGEEYLFVRLAFYPDSIPVTVALAGYTSDN